MSAVPDSAGHPAASILRDATPWLSIIVPVLDDAPALDALLERLRPLRTQGVELIVVDGGSRDDSVALACARSTCVLTAPAGRARQMNAGAALA
ncbi:MAG TPA: glycosyltransferase, partial [Plasticicumulans sp.]|nr:glycosyltransferase [Plasticicumulans sp.]